MKFLNALFEFPSLLCDAITNLWLGTAGEFVPVDYGRLAEYRNYDNLNPHRFEVRYDSDYNRLWHNEYKS